MPLFSIIIPVYNNSRAELERCLKSVQTQTFKDFEVIVLDDGSNPICHQEIDELTANMTNCRTIHKKNEGVSATRNQGIRLAKGKYIAFADADDMLPGYFLADAESALRQKDYDFVYVFVLPIKSLVEFKAVKEEIFAIEMIPKVATTLSEQDKRQLYCHMFDLLGNKFKKEGCFINRGPVARIVRKSIAESCPFDTALSLGEDAVWNLSLLKIAKIIGVVDTIWYLYFRHEGSASQKFDDSYKNKCSLMLSKLWEMADDTVSKTACLHKVFEITKSLADHYYLTDNFKQQGLLAAARDFKTLRSQSPWNLILQYTNVRRAGWKELLKYILIKSNLILPVYAILIKPGDH